jgi:DNA helicase HerA-like ATPase
MMTRVQELCRKLKPVLGSKVDGLWRAYVADSDADGKADIEQTLELLAAKHVGTDYQPDRSPFPPPAKSFAAAGDIPVGMIAYGARELYPFALRSGRLKEHALIAGRSGSGKTNLSFVLMQGIMNRGVKVLALDWKRAYRDLLPLQPDLRVYTIGREVAPFRFNPFIPPPGCEVQVWTKLIVDVIASAYLGGEGVISLLIAGLDRLYPEARDKRRWPTVIDLLVWLRTVKLRGRAAMWQASAERILLAMTYGEFGAVLNTQDNSHLQNLLDDNVILEMDGLSSSSDRVMFSEAITLYLYRYRLSLGPKEKLTNVIVLEEAHNLLLAKQTGTKESGLETSIRMIRQYGLGYVLLDQSASLLSRVAFANSYVTLALSQKLRVDIKTMSGAMNLTEEQEEALSTLPIGSAVVRLADEHPEPFLIRIPRCSIREGSVSDSAIRRHMATYSGESAAKSPPRFELPAVPPFPTPDKNTEINPTTIIAPPPNPPK